MIYQRVYIEITNVCNLSCPFCLNTTRKPGFMSVPDFEKVLTEVQNHTDHLYLHLKGEPTLHPQLKEIMDLAAKYHKKVHLVTNGTLLSQLNFDLGSHPALAQISISLHSIQTLDDVTKQKYLTTLQTWIKRSEVGSFSLFLRIWNENNSELLSWLRSVLETDFVYHPNKHRLQLKRNLALDFDRAFTWPSLNHSFVSETGHCYGGLKMMGILTDGTVTPCCLDNEGDMALGNILNTPFDVILKSGRYQNFVTKMAQNQFSENLCQHCTYHLKHKKINS
jgi:radical SAM protein with 4Fe4S-binding SPASM domain